MLIEDDTMVTISRAEYEELVKDSEFLAALFTAGVDSWEGYYSALEMVEDDD